MKYGQEELNVTELLRKALKLWWVFAILMLIGAGASYYIDTYQTTPLYRATTTIFVGKDLGLAESVSMTDLNLGDKLASDYTELVKSNMVLESVVKELGISTSVQSLRGNISIDIPEGSRFLYLTVVDRNPENAARAADTISKVLKIKANEIIGTKNISIVDYAKVPKSPIYVNSKRNMLIGAIIGLFISSVIVCVIVILNNKIQKEEDVEEMLGLTVIGSIPKFKGDRK